MAVAKNYASLLAYKDEYEVARLLTLDELRAELEQRFEPGGRIEFNLAPPLISRSRPGLRPKKRAFSVRILPFLAFLAKLKFLRGTRFDPFGWTAERRQERALIGHYESLVDVALERFDTSRREHVIRLLNLADAVRGYGLVKDAAIVKYHRNVEIALRDLENVDSTPSSPMGQSRATQTGTHL